MNSLYNVFSGTTRAGSLFEGSRPFYQELVGLTVARRFNPGACEIAFLESAPGETMVELVQLNGCEYASVKRLVISFHADEALNAVCEKAQSMGYAPGDICSAGPKPRYFQVADPDGVIIEFIV